MKPRKQKHVDLTYIEKDLPCPKCGHKYLRTHSVGAKKVVCLRVDLHIRYRKYQCDLCCTYLSTDMTEYSRKGCRYTHKVMSLAMAMHKTGRYTLVKISAVFARKYGIVLPYTTIHEWTTREEA